MRHSHIARLLALLMVVVLVAAACGGDDPVGSGGADEPAADSEPAAEPAESSTSSTTTAAIPEGGESAEGLHISEVVFGDGGHTTVTNSGDSTVDLSEIWVCNRPAYVQLSGSLEPGESIEVPAGELSGLVTDRGEVALYTSSDFGSSDAMIDYVQWGTGGGRTSVAVVAGLWPEGAAVQPTGDLIELLGAPGDPEAWG